MDFDMDLARAPRRRPLTARKKGSGYENGTLTGECLSEKGHHGGWRSFAFVILRNINTMPMKPQKLKYFQILPKASGPNMV
jgi:hypothetical protein